MKNSKKAKQEASQVPYPELSNLNADQIEIVYCVLQKIQEWFECEDLSTFQPMQCTIASSDGPEVTELISTLACIVRRLTGIIESVVVTSCT